MIDKIKVAGINYDVQQVEYPNSNDGSVNLGLCNLEQSQIEINKHASQERQKQTLVHELTHAILFEAGLDWEDEEDNEDVANRIGLVLYQVLTDNDFTWINK